MVLIGGGLFIMGAAMGARHGGPPAFLGCIYIPFALLYFFPALFLFQYASLITRFQNTPDAQSLHAALAKQKSFWKFVGIMMVVILSIYLIFIIVMIIAGIAGAAFMH
jgi:hypothetical protein